MFIDRRAFLAAAGGAAMTACGGGETPAPEAEPETKATFSRPLGAQLYTLRSILPDNPAQTLKDLAALGYQEAEVLQAGYDQLQPMVADAGLKAVSIHLVSSIITGTWGDGAKPALLTVEAAAEFAAEAGLSYLVMPYLGQSDRGTTLDHYKALGEKLNAAGEAAKAAGLGFAYHNHAFEFEPMEGSTPLDAILSASDPELVGLELDVFWVSIAGLDPVEMIQQYSGRIPLMHLKDKAADAPTQFAEGVPKEAFKEVGSGVIDFPAVLAAGEEAGVKHFFVEQDQTSGDPLDSLKKSIEYLRAVEL